MSQLEDFRNNTGVFAEQSADVQDAAVQDEAPIDVEDTEEYTEQTDNDTDTDESIDEDYVQQDDEEDELPELSPKEKTAFEKRMERESKKIEERLAKELDEKYSPFKRVVDKLGGDPDKIEQMLQQRQIQAEAEQLAYSNGWDDDQTQWYVNQRNQELQQVEMQKELEMFRISDKVNDLRDDPSFPGIHSMKKEIADVVAKSGNQLDVKQAYWALGGEKRAQQMKRETEQRAAVKRRTRVVASDTPSAASTEQIIPAHILSQAQHMGVSEKELRELASFSANNINDYRKTKKAK
jgi:hypothetical protein